MPVTHSADYLELVRRKPQPGLLPRIFMALAMAFAAASAPAVPGVAGKARVAEADTLQHPLVTETKQLVASAERSTPDKASGAHSDNGYGLLSETREAAAEFARSPSAAGLQAGIVPVHAARAGLSRAPPAV